VYIGAVMSLDIGSGVEVIVDVAESPAVVNGSRRATLKVMPGTEATVWLEGDIVLKRADGGIDMGSDGNRKPPSL
jgi:uncharacterized protein YacL (UPF0231 family)